MSPLDITDDERVLSELRGSTLLTYWYLTKKGRDSSGVREVQRALGFSSPSSASYQLEKLRNLGLASKNASGDYKIVRIVKLDVIEAFMFFRGRGIPKHLIYALATSLMILIFVLSFVNSLSFIVVAALMPGIVAAAVFWYEAVKIWRHRPLRR